MWLWRSAPRPAALYLAQWKRFDLHYAGYKIGNASNTSRFQFYFLPPMDTWTLLSCRCGKKQTTKDELGANPAQWICTRFWCIYIFLNAWYLFNLSWLYSTHFWYQVVTLPEAEGILTLDVIHYYKLFNELGTLLHIQCAWCVYFRMSIYWATTAGCLFKCLTELESGIISHHSLVYDGLCHLFNYCFRWGSSRAKNTTRYQIFPVEIQKNGYAYSQVDLEK